MKSGFVGVIGRANAGKSTLVNVIVGEKVSIVSPKPQTTRDRIMGVYNSNNSQIAFIDTPGIYKAKNLLNQSMQKAIGDATEDVDLLIFVLDAHDGVSAEDKELTLKYYKAFDNFILVLSKTDIMPESLLIDELNEFKGCDFPIIPVSARKGRNVKELIKVIESKIPDGEKIFGDDVISNRSVKFMISEIMREKILLKFEQEIPHGVAVIVNEFKERQDKKTIDISLDIICEKGNHKAIIIGKGGNKIKEVSTFARQDMEKFLKKKVFLTTYVKVKEDWRNSVGLIKEYGYGEDNL